MALPTLITGATRILLLYITIKE